MKRIKQDFTLNVSLLRTIRLFFTESTVLITENFDHVDIEMRADRWRFDKGVRFHSSYEPSI